MGKEEIPVVHVLEKRKLKHGLFLFFFYRFELRFFFSTITMTFFLFFNTKHHFEVHLCVSLYWCLSCFCCRAAGFEGTNRLTCFSSSLFFSHFFSLFVCVTPLRFTPYFVFRLAAEQNACAIGGVNCLRLMHEHTATALAYGIYKSAKGEFSEKVRSRIDFRSEIMSGGVCCAARTSKFCCGDLPRHSLSTQQRNWSIHSS